MGGIFRVREATHTALSRAACASGLYDSIGIGLRVVESIMDEGVFLFYS